MPATSPDLSAKLIFPTKEIVEEYYLPIIYTACRTCYSEQVPDQIWDRAVSRQVADEKQQGLVRKVMESGHGSTIEHVNFTFAISGVTRTLSHQLVRHRAGTAFDQQSQRYVSFKQRDNYTIPDSISNGDLPDDLAGRFQRAVDDNLDLYGQLLQAEVPAEGRPRTVDLAADPAASAPTLAQVRGDEALALRHPRTVTADECGPDGTYEPGLAPMLVWGGEPLSDTDGPALFPGPNGEQIGWATMEHRSVLRRLPRSGDRIQSFGATVQVFEKNTHRVMWAYDVDRGDLLAANEVVDLAFDTITRRAVPVPEARRQQVQARLRPQYASL